MLIAKQKKKENIAEYVLYMWQIEDIIRASGFNLDVIDQNIISRFQIPDEQKKQMRDWYDNIITTMQNEHVTAKGHIQVLKNVVDDLNDLHLELLRLPSQIQYNTVFFSTLSFLVEFRAKSKAGPEVNDVELSLNLLYEVLLLRLQHRQISEGTTKAVAQVSKFMALLSAKYKAYNNGELKLDE